MADDSGEHVQEAAESVHTLFRISSDKEEEKREAAILEDHALDVLRQLAANDALTTQDVEMRPLLGGATNKLYLATLKTGDANKSALESVAAVLRVYGPGTEKLIDRDFEIRVLEKLGRLGIGAKLLKSWGDGRAEQFLSGFALRRRDLKRPDVLKNLGRSLGILHTLTLEENEASLPQTDQPWVLKVIYEWGDLARKAKNGLFIEKIDKLLTEFGEVVERLWSCWECPLVLSHNDINAGNILISEDPEHNIEKFYLLDYEYSGYNFQFFDLANFWCETFMDNHHSKFPFFQACLNDGLSEDGLRILVQNYLAAYKSVEIDQVGEEDIRRTMCSVKVYSLGSHVLWGVWGLSQSEVVGVPFGFEEYGLQRIELFYKWKHEVMMINPPSKVHSS